MATLNYGSESTIAIPTAAPVLECLQHLHRADQETRWSTHARVSRDWQGFAEEANFRRLTLRASDALLPSVGAVTTLMVRRQYYRAFSIADALAPLLLSLTSLEGIVYEP
ncbi:hypothetical protein B0H63DRAFT_529902 [Podospora didyma]|uniref:Uncharacterized protein n=1 Tax=Podospora didyma TaxID=330526 RepID=A0AAE0JYR3_9PEZI|nr:hypothetical protein B0H63DRAFT_529902 [Podospora didyma]